jgi:hypothetical protein
LWPVCGEGIHVHDIEPAGKRFIKGGESIAEADEALYIGLERLCLVDKLGEGGLEEAEAMGRVGVCAGAGEAEERALGDAAEGRAVRRLRGGHAHVTQCRATRRTRLTIAMALAAVFSQAQASVANHRKNCVNLYKIHVQAAGDVGHTSKATDGEDDFARSFLDMVSRALVVKKGVASADRILRFVGAYIKFINEKGPLGLVII